jgi:hypothetical protein
MKSFWTPRRGSVGRAFVKLAEALRNYAALPPGFRSPAWLALQEAETNLAEHLAGAGVDVPLR